MEKQNKIQEITQTLCDMIGVKAVVSVTQEDDVFIVKIDSDDASLLIGKHARTLASLQRVLSAMTFKNFDEKVNILVDINDYRDQQKERLQTIANNIAERVINEKKNAKLSSFNAYERRIIHEHISQNFETLESHSEGEGKFRQLVIALKDDSKE